MRTIVANLARLNRNDLLLDTHQIVAGFEHSIPRLVHIDRLRRGVDSEGVGNSHPAVRGAAAFVHATALWEQASPALRNPG
jgi:hypothetical protein